MVWLLLMIALMFFAVFYFAKKLYAIAEKQKIEKNASDFKDDKDGSATASLELEEKKD